MRALIALVALSACGRVDFDPKVTRNRISVLGSQIGETLTDLPVLVRLRAPEVDLDEIAADGADLRFFSDDLATPLPYEIQGSSADGVDAWVRIPSLAGDLSIWVTYGNPAAEPGPPPESVWTSTFLGVWHFEDGHDSTANHLDAMFTGTASVDGIAGSAREFDPGYGTVPNDPILANLGAITWSAWINLTSRPPATSSVITRQHEATALDDFRIGPSGSLDLDAQINVEPGTRNIQFGASPIQQNTWQLISFVHDGTELRIGIDGVTTDRIDASGTIHPSSNPVWFGAGCNGCVTGVPSSDLFPGIIDEVRLEAGARDDAWLLAERLNLAGELVIVHPM